MQKQEKIHYPTRAALKNSPQLAAGEVQGRLDRECDTIHNKGLIGINCQNPALLHLNNETC